MTDADSTTPPPPAEHHADAPRADARGALASTQERADALGVAVRRALWPALAIVLVIAAQAVAQLATVTPDEVPQPGVFVVYSLMLLAMLPVMVTVGAAGASALLTKEALPATALAVTAGVVTTAWVAWIAGGWRGLLFGVVLGASTAAAALVLTGRRPLWMRLLVALLVVAVGAVATLWVGTVV
ncbi:hypothetical protein Xcel_3306 [Xylanimonas cellulosilytica DSM 15894]|uniref:Uncharacterized protein n=1 Tax=Xylanimonas cellulosilytica (strain DSM 15894 / JCM 12276 / CECT 5975 / KCTC 9989 / LMG 20990 / NBRC 107835 / XIL07) TaxID=446471 RepID=D1BRP0_XYLCX|nr:hypothetical protein [Xylanimonas cellulosilytica]ACZ32306.1 hypothetical protein Xcel_3306 [Xylanimonas cellulosilytica DSM 15894]